MSTYKLYGQMCGFKITNTFLYTKYIKVFQQIERIKVSEIYFVECLEVINSKD